MAIELTDEQWAQLRTETIVAVQETTDVPRHVVEDAVQTAIERLLRAGENGEIRNPPGYLLRITQNVIRRQLRQSPRSPKFVCLHEILYREREGDEDYEIPRTLDAFVDTRDPEAIMIEYEEENEERIAEEQALRQRIREALPSLDVLRAMHPQARKRLLGRLRRDYLARKGEDVA